MLPADDVQALYSTRPTPMHTESTALVATLVTALIVLLRKSFHLSNEFSQNSRRSSSITEPLMPPRLKSDSGLYELLDRHKNRGKVARNQALDAFRGLTLSLMVFVNYGGGGFAVFTHSIWDGLTIADLVFPWFAWILGFSVFLSSDSSRETSKLEAFSRIGQRTVKLFVLGLFINNGDTWSEWRIPGVLQALSFAHLIVAVADWFLPLHDRRRTSLYRVLVWHLILGVLPLILVNLLLTFTLHVPGCPAGYIGPGGQADGGVYRNCTGGAHLYVDSLVFGLHHIFQTPTCQQRYQTGPYDPEGLLNWIMVATTAYLGYLQAALLTITLEQSQSRQLRLLTVCGSGLILSGIVSGGLWVFPHGPWIPLNKNLWSLSYVLLSSGLASWLLALLTILIDGEARVRWSGAPCTSVGKNSIFIYVMHEVCQYFAPFAAKPLQTGERLPQFELLLYNLVGLFTWIIVAQWMDLQKIFIKV
ncbi:hypothetical protein F441_14182 [Phytophthora nicotianae CJ01A1]|uniref:Heparan-alpha-glucosaminide N-acetyltransferase catalytic domain-containing protein n=7 Tax=Phytophthora nicotianae TaxID=4792 RepID=W2YW55_PHYNI|nr:hypothetical protein L915_13922 [Phytophthora nicotianae]ETP10097.1 hypothetical protein F441_14182 [Phytophthora nicotianae CJ01A1]ETP38184.1 hypothetical protein F442_14128 [Phytophthora nicotianae P10297]